MALSFEDSLNSVKEENNMVTIAANEVAPVSAYSLNDEIAEIVPLSLEAEGWTRLNRFAYYSEYDDSNICTIDDEKNVTVNRKQVNITKESNSQFIPFEMPRFYDGFDLTTVASIQIYFVNVNNEGGRSNAINVYYNDSKIRFGWLLNSNATAVTGKLSFEIQAMGQNSKGENYIWKTRPNDTLNVLRSLESNGEIVPDDEWITSFLTQVNEKVSEAANAAAQAQGAVSTVQQYANNAAASAAQAQGVVTNAKNELEATVQSAVDAKVNTALSNYYTKTQVYTKAEVNDIVTNIDISDQLDEIKQSIANIDGLANFRVEYDGTTMTFYNGSTVMKEIQINSDPSAEWTAAYTQQVEQKIATAKSEMSSAVSGTYATKTEVNAVSSVANSNKTSVDALSEKVLSLDEIVNSIDTSPRLTYDISYNTDGDYRMVFYEIENEGNDETENRVEKAAFVIQGGGGGGGGSSVLKIEYVTTSPVVATLDDKVVIKYLFSGTDSSGDEVPDGTATWKVGGRVVATNTAISGENSFDITEYIAIGTQKVNLTITDDAGSLVSKNWTVQKVDVKLESTFNDNLTYPMGKVSFDYTPYGAVEKTVHFKLDGTEIGTVVTGVSGIPMAYEIPAQTHGAHLLEAYMTLEINGKQIESNHIVKDIIWYDSNSTVPVIGCVQQDFTAMQYDATNIVYSVYDPSTETPTVTLAVDGNVVSTLTLETNTNTWQYKSMDVGDHVLTITCGETVKTLVAHIEKIDIDLEPVTAGLVFDFNPSGKSNNDSDRLWSNGDVSMTVSDNFDWVNGGYQIDDNGDQYFCIKAGTSAVIDYNLFEDDAKRNGKEFKLIFKTSNVQDASANFLSCVDGADNAKIGIVMNVHEAYIHAGSGSLYLPYSEEDIIEFEFNISKNTDDIPMIMGYEDGVATRPMVYSDMHDFTQIIPKYISIGSDKCDVFIYRFKVYNTSLTDRGILNNFIADARNAEEMIARYTRNQIYDENQQLTPEILAEKCPWLRIIKLDAPHFTNDKKDKVIGTTIQYIYKDGDPVLDNWTAYDCQHSGRTPCPLYMETCA